MTARKIFLASCMVLAVSMLANRALSFGVGFGEGMVEGLEEGQQTGMCETVCRRSGYGDACSRCWGDLNRWTQGKDQAKAFERYQREQTERDAALSRKLDDIQRCQRTGVCY